MSELKHGDMVIVEPKQHKNHIPIKMYHTTLGTAYANFPFAYGIYLDHASLDKFSNTFEQYHYIRVLDCRQLNCSWISSNDIIMFYKNEVTITKIEDASTNDQVDAGMALF